MGDRLNESLDALDFYDFYERWLTPYLSDSLNAEQRQAMRAELLQVIDTLHGRVPPAQHRRWGWKNPRSLLLLPLLDRCIEKLRFIQVVRDGRDMAYSANQNQLRKHGTALLDERQQAQPEPLRSLAFWQSSNLRAAQYGASVMRGRYLWLRYESVVAGDGQILAALADFLQIDPEKRALLHGHARPAPSIGRWRQQPDEEQRSLTAIGAEGLRFFGYSLM